MIASANRWEVLTLTCLPDLPQTGLFRQVVAELWAQEEVVALWPGAAWRAAKATPTAT